MIIDSSALIAILTAEPGSQRLHHAIAEDETRLISAASYVETAMVVEGRDNPVLTRHFERYLIAAQITITELTPKQAQIARRAFRDFGKGRGHPARLNFGDCLAYATAVDLGEPLLFVGHDFGFTDVRAAIDLSTS